MDIRKFLSGAKQVPMPPAPPVPSPPPVAIVRPPPPQAASPSKRVAKAANVVLSEDEEEEETRSRSLNSKHGASAAAVSPSASERTPAAEPAREPSAPKDLPLPKAAPAASGHETMLWADKYAPVTLDDLVGAPALVKSLTQWLANWEDVHVTKRRAPPPYEKSNPGGKAVLISGPPGIGKSTTARLVSAQCGRTPMELNASDTRSKKLLSEVLDAAVTSRVITLGSLKGKPNGKDTRRVVIMDEVDGMSGSDRGGMMELIKTIKRTKVPIICICNDNAKPAVRSLAGHCFDLRMSRPVPISVIKRLRMVAQKEKLSVDDAALEGLIKSSGNDIRQCLNAMQMWSADPGVSLSKSNADARMRSINKDAIHRLSSFDACRFIFNESRRAPLEKRSEAFFSDFELIPLMIAQSYVGAVAAGGASLERLARAADAVVDADTVGSYVRGGDMRWDLLSTQAVLNLRVAYLAQGDIGFPGFPEWLGKNSTRNRRARLLSELAVRARAATTCDASSLRLDYLPYLREALLTPMLDPKAAEKVGEVVDRLDAYGMSRDDFFVSMEEIQFGASASEDGGGGYPGFPNKFAKIASASKAALTREYNRRAHADAGGAPKKAAKRGRSDDAFGDEDMEGGEGDDDAVLEDETPEGETEEEIKAAAEAFRVKRRKAATPAAAKRKSPASNKSAAATKSGTKKRRVASDDEDDCIDIDSD